MLRFCTLPLAVLAATPALLPAQEPLQRPAGPALFGPAPAGATLEVEPESFALRTRIVALDIDALRRTAADGAGAQLALNLFADLQWNASFERHEPAWGGGETWMGSIEGDPYGHATFSIMKDAVAGTVRAHGHHVRISYGGPGVHLISELDDASAPVCGTGPEHAVGGFNLAPRRSGGGRRERGTTTPYVDVLVVYSPAARSGAGGANAIQALINQAINETNSAYSQSNVDQRLALVHAAELIGYNEAGSMGTDLSRIRSTSDGFADEIHTWRNDYGADCVAMIGNNNQYCGIAYVMTFPSVSFASSAFSVTYRGCATGYYSFGHELGHNMGCAHDPANAGGAAYNYSYGYRTPNNQYRTIMAYSPGSRIRRFSDPDVDYNGWSMGVEDAQDNSRSLNNTIQYVQDWRDSEGGGGPTIDPMLEIVNLTAGSTALLQLETCTPEETVYVAYSLSGPGPTTTPYGDADLSPPITLIPVVTNWVGSGQRYLSIPANASGVQVWFQAADEGSGTLSNSLALTVE